MPKSCSNMVRLDLVDAAVDQAIRNHFNIPKMELEVIPGTDHSAELAALEFELRKLPERGLPWEDEDAERAKLRAEIRRVEALPVVPDLEKWEPTGKTFAELWAEVRPADRALWLRAEGFTVRANKTLVVVTKDEWVAEIPLARLGNQRRAAVVQVLADLPPAGGKAFPAGVAAELHPLAAVRAERRAERGVPARPVQAAVQPRP